MPPLEETISKLSTGLLALAPGPLAALRRMEAGSVGEPAYWRLASQCGFRDGDADIWMQIVIIMAILVPKGQRTPDHRLHVPKQCLGAVLCDGGNAGWRAEGSEPRPVLSETRLARFLALPAAQRGPALERIARMLATRRDPQQGLNCTEIAALLLRPQDQRNLQNIARDYYRRLDYVAPEARTEETEA